MQATLTTEARIHVADVILVRVCACSLWFLCMHANSHVWSNVFVRRYLSWYVCVHATRTDACLVYPCVCACAACLVVPSILLSSSLGKSRPEHASAQFSRASEDMDMSRHVSANFQTCVA